MYIGPGHPQDEQQAYPLPAFEDASVDRRKRRGQTYRDSRNSYGRRSGGRHPEVGGVIAGCEQDLSEAVL